MPNKKGLYNGVCYHATCSAHDALWYNHDDKKYYCQHCARQINAQTRRDAIVKYGHNTCTPGRHHETTMTVLNGEIVHRS